MAVKYKGLLEKKIDEGCAVTKKRGTDDFSYAQPLRSTHLTDDLPAGNGSRVEERGTAIRNRQRDARLTTHA